MLWKIAGFEFRFQLLSPAAVAIFAIFLLLVFGGVSAPNISIGNIGASNYNSPYALTQYHIILTLFGGIIPTVFLSSGVLRDFSFKTSELFYSRPVRELEFVLGRFIGGFLITALVFASVPLGAFLGSTMPSLDPERLGTTNLVYYLDAYIVFGLGNLLTVGAILFTVSNFTRSTVMTYSAFVGVLVLYITGLILAGNQPDLRETFALLDPFGFTTYVEATRYWTVFEQNSQRVVFEELVITNRLTWFGIALALVLLNLFAFRFRKSGGIRFGGRKGVEASGGGQLLDTIDLPRSEPNTNASIAQFLARLDFEFKGVVFNVAFWILLALGLFNTIPGFIIGLDFYGTPNYPLTRTFIDMINGGFSWLPTVVIIYYAAEVMWRERRVGFSYIVDATPTPSWIFISTKFIALCFVVLALIGVAMGAAILTQALMGFEQIDYGQYLLRGLYELVIPATFVAALSIFAQVITNNRWLGMTLMLIFLVSQFAMAGLGLQNYLYRFSQNPGLAYSDLVGYGHFLGIASWFHLYWAFVSLLLLVLSFQLWSRGALTPIFRRLRGLLAMTPATALIGLVAIAGATATGSWIHFNTGIRNEYVTSQALEARAADYEREWIHLLDEPQPKLTAIDVEVDIYPFERRYDVRGHYLIENRTEAEIDTVWVTYGQAATIHEHAVEGARLETEDDRFHTYGFALDTPMQPGETRRLDFTVSNENPGFRNSGNDTSVRYNGTFFNNGAVFPALGFNTQARLGSREARRRQGLEPIERAYDLEDESRWNVNYIRQDADYVDFRAIVSTVPEQIAIAPGYLQREWEENGRRYFEYEMDAPILAFAAFFSGEYELAERVTDGVLQQVYYHADHDWNVERMLYAGERSIAYFSEHFSPYQYRQYRTIEFPGYATFAQSFPNTIAYSERIGFTTNLSDPTDLDPVFYVTAHEAAHQWWAHQVMSANTQGGTMIVETMAQYSALMLMQDEYGPDHMRRFLKFELDNYLSARGSEVIEEMPLYRVENQGYIHYRKGAVILYALQDYLGEETINRVLRRLIEERQYSARPYATTLDFMRLLREEAGPEWEGVIHDFFERIVLFDLEVANAEAREREDGRWDVVIDVEARKLIAEGDGRQTEEDIDYLIDIGVFTENLDDAYEGTDHVLFMEKRRINETMMRFELIVDEQPLFAGVDPYNKLIDRNSDDNLSRISIVEEFSEPPAAEEESEGEDVAETAAP